MEEVMKKSAWVSFLAIALLLVASPPSYAWRGHRGGFHVGVFARPGWSCPPGDHAGAGVAPECIGKSVRLRLRRSGEVQVRVRRWRRPIRGVRAARDRTACGAGAAASRRHRRRGGGRSGGLVPVVVVVVT